MILNYVEWIEQIKTQLGYPVINLYIQDDMIRKQIDISLRKVAPWCDAVEQLYVTNKVTTFNDKKLYAVIRVTSLDSSYTTDTENNGGMSYYDLLISKSIYNQLGGTKTNTTSSLVNTALYNYYSTETRSTLCPIGFRLVDQTLYIDGDNPPYQVEAVTDGSLVKMSQNYCSWCEEYSLALCKIIEGEIRRKIKVTGSPIELSSELLSDGRAEKEALEAKLGSSMGLYFCTR